MHNSCEIFRIYGLITNDDLVTFSFSQHNRKESFNLSLRPQDIPRSNFALWYEARVIRLPLGFVPKCKVEPRDIPRFITKGLGTGLKLCWVQMWNSSPPLSTWRAWQRLDCMPVGGKKVQFHSNFCHLTCHAATVEWHNRQQHRCL